MSENRIQQLQREIAERQAELARLVLGDPRIAVSLPQVEQHRVPCTCGRCNTAGQVWVP